MTTSLKRTAVVLAVLLLAGSGTAFATVHSDYTRSYPLATLKTFQFNWQNRISRDPLADNDIWANDARQAIREQFASRGIMETTDGRPDFYVALYVGLKERYDVDSVGYGLPVFHPGFRGRWWGWPSGYDVWAVPYTESTVIVDVIDAHTNQLVWRGYDTDTLNMKDPDKTLTRAVHNVVERFNHDMNGQHQRAN